MPSPQHEGEAKLLTKVPLGFRLWSKSFAKKDRSMRHLLPLRWHHLRLPQGGDEGGML